MNLLTNLNWCLYKNMDFWTVVISGLALILSQLSPIISWFKKGKIELDIYPTILINHKVGNPILNAQIKLTNVGGRDIKINKLVIKI